MPTVVDESLVAVDDAVLARMGLDRAGRDKYELRDAERLDLLTPGGRRRMLTLARSRPVPDYRTVFSAAWLRPGKPSSAAVHWRGAEEQKPVLDGLVARLHRGQVAVQVAPGNVKLDGDNARLIQRAFSVVACDIVDLGVTVEMVEGPGAEDLGRQHPIAIDVGSLERALGRTIPDDRLRAACRWCGYELASVESDGCQVLSPPWRAGGSAGEVMADLVDQMIWDDPVSAVWVPPRQPEQQRHQILQRLVGLGFSEVALRETTDIGLPHIDLVHERVRNWAGRVHRSTPTRGFDVMPMTDAGTGGTAFHLVIFGVAAQIDPNPLYSAIAQLCPGAVVETTPQPLQDSDACRYFVGATGLFTGTIRVSSRPVSNRWISLAILEMLTW